jgi:fructose/tagatose bisphosphate aldolase
MEISFSKMMKDAEKRNYAVGYFESWNLESLLAVCDAAEKVKSPVIIGFGGLMLKNSRRIVDDRIGIYASLAKELCANISVPACTIFNESIDFDSVIASIDDGYDVVMFIGPGMSLDKLSLKVSEIVEKAHKNNVAVEGEIDELPGLDRLTGVKTESRLTDPDIAKEFVSRTGVDSFSINIGQSHKPGKEVNLDFELLKKIRKAVKVPLVLHGGSNMDSDEISKAIDMGVRKFNLGGILKKKYLEALKKEIEVIGENSFIYEVVGSGFREDILVKARFEVQKTVESYMKIYRSAGKA